MKHSAKDQHSSPRQRTGVGGLYNLLCLGEGRFA